ncbi:hypothetical protein P9274_20110 [Schinkia azotoformans]|uniref:hypothetical protein n=1 Tax=Schinkia azotoformans TaxID=1454 RepID=UPI002E22FD57|nr:hypothetical protein [Schinkia azotoformans]
MNIIKIIWYGVFMDYHLRKKDTINPKYKTVLRYHYEMALHYYEKAYGKEFEV